jgi:phospholipase C
MSPRRGAAAAQFLRHPARRGSRATAGSTGAPARLRRSTPLLRLLLPAVLLVAFLAAPTGASATPEEGIHNIKHVVMIMQENRSFDSYFGTFPGADGIPTGICVPDPAHGGCVKPYHDNEDQNTGGPHGSEATTTDIAGGAMNGFVASADQGLECTTTEPNCSGCKLHASCVDVMGYHDAREIPNYWTYAKDFALQDNMFESASSWSLPEHLYLVSAWSAVCKNGDEEGFSCVGSLSPDKPGNIIEGPIQRGVTTYGWTDITYLLAKHGVSWRYYVFEGREPDCESDESLTCAPVSQSPRTPGIWNPLADFTAVKQDKQLSNIQGLNSFYSAVHETSKCGLPNVSWIDPTIQVSEHPASSIKTGQAYVTTLVNSIMRSPCWGSTAIFLSWDDWGGFYDHVRPPVIDEQGYGLRVPGLVISPYAKSGYIDHQQLSHDAYLKFIEDDFLSSQRLNSKNDGRPDNRPDVREEAPGLGSITEEFNFSQAPRAPVLLSPHPPMGPPSTPPGGGPIAPTVLSGAATSRTERSATLNASVNPNGSAVTSCVFEYGTTEYSSRTSCIPATVSGSSMVSVSAPVSKLSPHTTYFFRVVATNAGGPGTNTGSFSTK